jgi:hypothetical protein
MTPRPRIYSSAAPDAAPVLPKPMCAKRLRRVSVAMQQHHADKRTMRAYDEAIRFPEDEEL